MVTEGRGLGVEGGLVTEWGGLGVEGDPVTEGGAGSGGWPGD